MSRHGSTHGTPRREPAGASLPAQHPLSRQLDAEGNAVQPPYDVSTPASAMDCPESVSASGSATPSARSGTSDGSAIEQDSFSCKGERNNSLDELQAQTCQDGDAVTKAWQDEAAPWQTGAGCTAQITPMQTAKFSTPDRVNEPTASCLVVRALNFHEEPDAGAEAPEGHCLRCCVLEAKLQEQQAQVGSRLSIQHSCKALRISQQCL